jgi:DNA-binding IclR family transcriptional regulator
MNMDQQNIENGATDRGAEQDGRSVRENNSVLETGMHVLEELSMTPAGLAGTELAARVGKDKGNLHRLMQTLVSMGYVEQNSDTKRYYATVQIVVLAGRILKDLDLLDIARPVMRRVRSELGESVHLARKTRVGCVYLAQERPYNRLTVETEVGSVALLHCSSTAKSVFAFASPEEVAEVVQLPLEQKTIRTHRTLESLKEDLREVRRRGYAIDDEEHNTGVRCVSAPIFDFRGNVIASIGISGPSDRVTVENIPDFGARIRAYAAEITGSLGGTVPEIRT